MRDKVTTRLCPQTTTFLKKKESRSGIKPRPFRFKPAHKPSCRPPLVIPPNKSGKGAGLWMCPLSLVSSLGKIYDNEGMTSHVFIQKMHYSHTSCLLYFLVPLSSFLAQLLALSQCLHTHTHTHVRQRDICFLLSKVNNQSNKQYSYAVSVCLEKLINKHQRFQIVLPDSFSRPLNALMLHHS